MNKKKKNLIIKQKKFKKGLQMNLENSIRELSQMRYKFWEMLEIGKSKKTTLMQKSLTI